MQIQDPRPEAVIMIGEAGRKPRPLRLTTRDECRELIRATALGAAMLPDDGMEPVTTAAVPHAEHPETELVASMSGSQTGREYLDGLSRHELERALMYISGYCSDAFSSAMTFLSTARFTQAGDVVDATIAADEPERGEHPYPDAPEHRGEFGTYPPVDSCTWNCQGCGATLIGGPRTYCRECEELKAGGVPLPREIVPDAELGARLLADETTVDRLVVDAGTGITLAGPSTARAAMTWVFKHGTEYESPLKVVPMTGTPYPGRDGYVAGSCHHPVPVQEWEAGYRQCEECDPSERFVTEGAEERFSKVTVIYPSSGETVTAVKGAESIDKALAAGAKLDRTWDVVRKGGRSSSVNIVDYDSDGQPIEDAATPERSHA